MNLGPVLSFGLNEFGVTYFEGGEGARAQLFFSSTRSGSFDICVTEQNPDGTCAAPILITELATSGTDITPAIRHDGLEIVFASNRPAGLGGHDIWVTTRESIFARGQNR